MELTVGRRKHVTYFTVITRIENSYFTVLGTMQTITSAGTHCGDRGHGILDKLVETVHFLDLTLAEEASYSLPLLRHVSRCQHQRH